MESLPSQDPRSQVMPDSNNVHQISFAEFGSSEGFPVLYFHGLPGSRFEASLWDTNAKALNVRLIAPDRPGMGLSTHSSTRVPTDYPVNVAGLVEHLHLEAFSILAVSGGGMYALACAVAKDKLPGLQRVAVVGGLGPRSMTQEGMGLVQKFSFRAMDWIPGGAVGWFWDVMVGKSARNPDPTVLEKAVKKGAAAAKGSDAEHYKNEEHVRSFTESLRGAFAQGSQGYVREATLVCQPWGFELADIANVAVTLWYGGKDDLAPIAVGKAMTERIPGAVFKGFDDETHIGTVMNHQKEVLADLAMK